MPKLSFLCTVMPVSQSTPTKTIKVYAPIEASTTLATGTWYWDVDAGKAVDAKDPTRSVQGAALEMPFN